MMCCRLQCIHACFSVPGFPATTRWAVIAWGDATVDPTMFLSLPYGTVDCAIIAALYSIRRINQGSKMKIPDELEKYFPFFIITA